MRRSIAESRDSEFREVNLTPLIDVSLVLVVMLLLATPLALESSISVRNSQRSGQVAEKDEEIKRLELMIVDEETVRVNRTSIHKSQLLPMIEPLIRDNPDQIVVVTCADQVSHGTFVSVLDEAKSSGAAQIAVVER